MQEAVEFTGYSESYIYKLIHSRKIPYYKPTKGKVFFRQSELEEFLLHRKHSADYEVSNKADEILNERKRKVVKR